MMEEINCLKCGGKEKTKSGFVLKKQRYLCKNCGCNYTQNHKYGYSKEAKDEAIEVNIEEYYDLIKIDINGLNSEEQKIIKILANSDKAIGLNNLACKSGIIEKILKNKYEPTLIKLDFLVRTFKWRKATDKCKQYKNIS